MIIIIIVYLVWARRGHRVEFLNCNLAKKLVHWFSGIVQRRSLEDYSASTTDASQREHPQEEPIQNHGHELPIFYYLEIRMHTLIFIK